MPVVSNSSELVAALSSATAGVTIELAGGQYDPVILKNFDFSGTVTVRSTDPEYPAVFSSLQVQASSNITFDGLVIAHPLATGEADWVSAMRIDGSSNIAVVNSEFLGSADGDATNDGQGLLVLDSQFVTVAGNTFHDLKIGAGFGRSTDIAVIDNAFHDIRTDGLTLGSVARVTVENNTFRDFHPGVGDHPDMIQVWNQGGVMDLADITIRANTFDCGNGDNVQTIFIQGVPPGQNGFLYTAHDITIEANVISGGSAQGIWVYDVTALAITDNTIAEADGADYPPTIRIERADGAVVTGNTAPSIQAVASEGVVFDGNLTLDGTGQPAGPESSTVILGTAAGDTLIGTAFADEIDGAGGDDTLTGGDGEDLLSGGIGNDLVTGDGGDDELHGGDGLDILFGGAGEDRLFGEEGNDIVWGDAGNDMLNGGGGKDELHGGDGNDGIYGGGADDRIFGEAGNDMLRGDGGNDMVNGGGGADVLWGDAGHDTLYGGGADDVLYGGDGNDKLWGDGGSDRLAGGSGADAFSFKDAWGHDVIEDFELGVDTFDFTRVTGLDDAGQITITETIDGTLLTFGANSVLLAGVVAVPNLSDYFIV